MMKTITAHVVSVCTLSFLHPELVFEKRWCCIYIVMFYVFHKFVKCC